METTKSYVHEGAWPVNWAMVIGLGAILAAGVGVSTQAAEEDPAAKLNTPDSVYSAACAACHGSDGTGQPQVVLGFETEVPDFTDCSFQTREPDPDWFAVAHEGGPVRGFAHHMPAHGDALSDAQIKLAVQHIRTFCAEEGWPSGNLNQARPMFTEKAFVEDEFVFTVGGAVQEPYEVVGELLYETRFGSRSMLEVVVPFGAVDMPAPDDGSSGGGWGGGLGDLGLGLKHVFVASKSSGTIFSGLLEAVLPTGAEDEGMGSGALVIEPMILIGQSLGPAGFLHFQAGAEVPIEPDPEMEAFWRMAYGYTFTEGAFGRAWSPMVEVLGSMDLEGGAKVHWDIAPQIQIALNTRQHIMLGLATRIPLEPGNDRPIGVWAYLLWEWFDGGFGEGW